MSRSATFAFSLSGEKGCVDREMWDLQPRGGSRRLEPWGLLVGPDGVQGRGWGMAGWQPNPMDCGRHCETSGPRGTHRMCVLLVTLDDISGVGTEAGFVEGSNQEGGRGPGRPLVGRIWWDW